MLRTCLAGAPGATDAVHIVFSREGKRIVQHSLFVRRAGVRRRVSARRPPAPPCAGWADSNLGLSLSRAVRHTTHATAVTPNHLGVCPSARMLIGAHTLERRRIGNVQNMSTPA